MLEIKLELTQKSLRFLTEAPKAFFRGLVEGMKKSMYIVEKEAKSSFGLAGNLKPRTGRLRGSIKSGVRVETGKVTGFVGSNVVYAAIHEFGGTIRPRVADYLVFQVNGNWIKTKKVEIPARPYLTPAIEDNMNKIKDMLETSIVREVKESER